MFEKEAIYMNQFGVNGWARDKIQEKSEFREFSMLTYISIS